MYVNNELMNECEGILLLRNFLSCGGKEFEINYMKNGVILIRYCQIGDELIKEGKLTIKCTEKQLDKINNILNSYI